MGFTQNLVNSGGGDGTSVIQKAEINLDRISSGGILLETQAEQFLTVMQRQASILRVCNVQPLNSPTQSIDKARFVSRVLNRGVEGTAPSEAQQSAPEFSKATWNAQEMVAEVPITVSAVEDAINRRNFVDMVLTLLANRAATDVEELMIKGDTASANSFFSLWDGMLVSATSNIHNAGGAVFDYDTAGDAIRTMPPEFRRRGMLRFMLDSNSEQFARDGLAARGTSMGDTHQTEYLPIRLSGIELLPSDVWPNDLGLANNETEIILASLDNVAVGVWRQMRIEQEYSARHRKASYILSLRADFTYLVEDAVVKITNVIAN